MGEIPDWYMDFEAAAELRIPVADIETVPAALYNRAVARLEVRGTIARTQRRR